MKLDELQNEIFEISIDDLHRVDQSQVDIQQLLDGLEVDDLPANGFGFDVASDFEKCPSVLQRLVIALFLQQNSNIEMSLIIISFLLFTQFARIFFFETESKNIIFEVVRLFLSFAWTIF